MKGIINLYKPKGITSSDAVCKCKKILGEKTVGHMGTLDPAGEGVLLLGVGKGARLFDYFLKKDKVYNAEFCFGQETDTLDGDGTVVRTTNVIPSFDELNGALNCFIGKQMQLPPAYSAKSINGVRAYKLARQGKEVELTPSPIEIYSLKIIEKTAKNTYMCGIHCSSGTYIRSLCRDIAAKLNTCATMVSIKRMSAGPFKVEDSVTIDELTRLKEKAVIPLTQALSSLHSVTLPDNMYTPLNNGIKIPLSGQEGDFALYCKNELFGIAHTVNGIIKIKTYLKD